MQLIVAEKPSVARDLARVLGIHASGRSQLAGKDRVITWCIGHLVELEEPASYDTRWKPWRLDTLPMIPATFKLRAVAGTADQLRVVGDLLRDNRFTEVVNACDAGREGELIFRYVYELARARLPIRRLWISSLTDEAIKQGFAGLRPGSQYDALADAARCRSEADWLVGMNATRAVTIRHRTGPESTLFSVGRVQTPTLAILVEREQAIRTFKPRDYWEVKGDFVTRSGPGDGARFKAAFADSRGKVLRLGALVLATEIVERDRAHASTADPAGPVVHRLTQKKTREPPPLLFDLTSLQRTANRRYGTSATRTLEVAQALYERHKVLTYPRTDSRHLPKDMVGELPRLFRGAAGMPEYAGFAQPLIDKPPAVSNRVFNDGKVQDHHAIIPTGKVAAKGALDRDEQRVFDLVMRRFLGVFYPDAEFASTEALIRVGEGNVPKAKPAAKTDKEGDEAMLDKLPPPPDVYVARGRVRLAAGWQVVAGIGERTDGDEEEAGSTATLPVLTEGQRLAGTFDSVAKQTRPPPRHTEATLLGAMESAGQTIEDEELRAAMKDSGLGTPATRAATIETLVKRGFIARSGKQVAPTELGIGLIAALPVSTLASPELTGAWEARLARIARGEETRLGFMKDIADYVRKVVDTIRKAPAGPTPPPAAREAPRAMVLESTGLACPRCKRGTLVTGKRGWGCDRWRDGCAFVVWFERDGKRLTRAQLRKLVSKGDTAGPPPAQS